VSDRARDFQQALADQVIRAYRLGPDEAGAARFTWPDGRPVSEAMTGEWTASDLIAGIGFLTGIITGLCFEVDQAQAEDRPADVTGFLDRCAMFLILARAAGVPAVPPEAGG
jgi:hypothetical protein